ncbi:MAG: CHAT domain-containing protein [Phaeodactylibacter sp.]|nr:CHAT domain-containing protein [Phaeodactylibacter sp.]
MKNTRFIFGLLFLSPLFSFGQADTAAVAREVDSLIQLAHNLSNKREFAQALETMARAKRLALGSFSEETVVFGNVCFQYGVICHQQGDHREAEKWLLRAKEIREKLWGGEHLGYAEVLYQLGSVYYHMGNNYERAEQCYLQIKAIREKKLGKEHLEYAASLNGLGIVYLRMGNYDLAEACFLEVLAIREKILGRENITYGGTLNNLAIVYTSKGNYEKAEIFYKENIRIIEQTLGKENTRYAGGIMNLASVYLYMRDFEKAEPLFLEAKSRFEGFPDYTAIPAYMSLMEFLGMLYFETGQYELSENYHIQAKELRGGVLGKEHLSYEMSLAKLSVLYWKTGHYDKAAQHFAEAAEMRRSLLSDASRHLSEKEVYAYVRNFEHELDKDFSFAGAAAHAVPSFAGACYDNTLFHKGFLLNISHHFRNRNAADQELAEKLSRLKSIRNLLSAQYARVPSERDSSRIAEWEGQANTVEKELARTVSGYGEIIRRVNWQDVQAALDPGEAALEFIRFNYYTPEPTDSVLYAALLLKPGMAHPLFIPLFEEKVLEALLPPLHKNRSEYVNQLYQDETLARLIWSPAEPHLQGVQRVYYSPSGLLHRLNLGALPVDKQGGALAGRYDIVALGSTRSVAGLPMDDTSAGPQVGGIDALIFGGIRYEMDSMEIAASPLDERANRGLSFSHTDSTLRGAAWKFLKHSEKEAASVTAILQEAGIPATAFRGYAATEEAFKQMGRHLPSPRILHVSTHGYFFPDPVLTGSKQLAAGSELAFRLSEHPMIRSGLILAGANHAWQTGRPLGNREDGVLTAYEISQMNLRNTELVVLSACETGLGDIRGNEGVYGLQRAFRIAGAKNLIMSLWQAPDFQSQELMTAFYHKWLLDKLPIHQALQAAQQEMQDKGYEPYYWAGWVLVE